ncbi:hypothetical protein ACFVVA_24560 [Kitasatospora sp. NPDC058048]|uniref:hypothetical protein n=1 Tax=Kitasatospora sp. NPDC058048 TaxID=3346313 RepID=UPI0036DCBA0D
MATPSAVSGSAAGPSRPVPTGRTTELVLVIGAVLIAVFGYVEVGVDLDGHVPADAAVTGFASQAYGTTRLEGTEDELLTGTDGRVVPRPRRSPGR